MRFEYGIVHIHDLARLQQMAAVVDGDPQSGERILDPVPQRPWPEVAVKNVEQVDHIGSSPIPATDAGQPFVDSATLLRVGLELHSRSLQGAEAAGAGRRQGEAGLLRHREVSGGRGTVAVRVPGLALPRRLARALGRPITGISANLHGLPPCRTARDVADAFPEGIAMILDGGTTQGGAPSTIVDLTGERPKLLREGVLPSFSLKPFLPDLIRHI